MKALLIDDEKRARVNLQLLLEEYCPQITIVAEVENLAEGVKAIRKHQPDLVFLDIEMPGHSGLELLDFFNEEEINFGIIFTTAYNEYAIQAFKFSAIDYLLKPINPEELTAAVERFEKQLYSKESLKLLKANIQKEQLERIAVPNGNSLLFLDIADIMYIKGDGAYSDLFMSNGVKHTVSRNLKNFEELFQEETNLLRIHKSYMVNMAYTVAFHKADGGSLELKNGTHLPVSSEKSQFILEKIQIVKR